MCPLQITITFPNVAWKQINDCLIFFNQTMNSETISLSSSSWNVLWLRRFGNTFISINIISDFHTYELHKILSMKCTKLSFSFIFKYQLNTKQNEVKCIQYFDKIVTSISSIWNCKQNYQTDSHFECANKNCWPFKHVCENRWLLFDVFISKHLLKHEMLTTFTGIFSATNELSRESRKNKMKQQTWAQREA